MAIWRAEHPVDARLAAELVQAQFPELAAFAPARVGAGWDCDVWRFGELAFRFPRRAMGVPLIEVELQVLPILAPLLPLAIPTPSHRGRPTAAFPFTFYGHPLVPGLPADRAGQGEAQRAALAPVLGQFLRDLHAIDPTRVGAPPDDFKFDMARKAERARPALAGLADVPGVERAAKLLADPPPSLPDGPAVLLHGDVYVRHLLLDGAGRLSGVIDWGDVRAGDRAIDLAVVYSFLPPATRPAFWAAYGEVDAATRRRARLTGLANHGVQLLAYARDIGDATLANEAMRSLAYVMG